MVRTTQCNAKCIYCGNQANTRDHIPPKCLFDHAADLLTVPCCSACNNSFSKDDEFFRASLAIECSAFNIVSTSNLIEPFIRSLQRPQAEGLRQHFIGSVDFVYIEGPGISAAYPTPKINLDQRRIDAVLRRIIWGLNYHNRPHEKIACTRIMDDLSTRSALTDPNRGRNLESMLASIPWHNIGDNVFMYRNTSDMLVPQAKHILWELRFFGLVRYYALCTIEQIAPSPA